MQAMGVVGIDLGRCDAISLSSFSGPPAAQSFEAKEPFLGLSSSARHGVLQELVARH